MTARGFAAQLAQDLEPEDLRMVLEVFRQDVERLTLGLEGSARDADAGAFRRTCHALAGAAGAVGATALERVCRDAMTRAAFSPADLAAALAEIRLQGGVALQEMEAFLAALPKA